MRSPAELDRCSSFIRCHLKPPAAPGAAEPGAGKLAITLSRQTGSGAWLVARHLADLLQERMPGGQSGWTIFDRELVEKVLEDHHLPKKLAQFMPEDRVSTIDDIMQEIVGLKPSSWTFAEHCTETILKLAELGHVILIGRGANVITARLEHVLHVRLVGALELRVARVQERLELSRKAALAHVRKADRGRRRYLQDHFRADIDDPLLYDLVVNTDRLTCPDVAELIAAAAMTRRRPAAGVARPAEEPPAGHRGS